MESELVYEAWLSSAGYWQEHWLLLREDGMELGYIMKTSWNNKFMATNIHNFKSAYRTTIENAKRWPDLQHKNRIPISRLNELVY